MSPPSVLLRCAVLLTLLASVMAHTAMSFPKPRGGIKKDYAFMRPGNACENESTKISEPKVFKRGEKFNPKWAWNNHFGGFVKFAMIKGVKGNVDNKPFLENKNIIAAQCYTGGCNIKGFDPGFTHQCTGKPVEIPDWVEDGVYTFQFSQIGGFDSDGIETKQLPLYHNCANIRVQGGKPLMPQPKNWIAPFVGGNQDEARIRGPKSGNDVCGFKAFNREPEDPRKVNVNKDVRVRNMKFGKPDGWAVAGGTQRKREDNLLLPRLGHIARVANVEEENVEEPEPEHEAEPEAEA